MRNFRLATSTDFLFVLFRLCMESMILQHSNERIEIGMWIKMKMFLFSLNLIYQSVRSFYADGPMSNAVRASAIEKWTFIAQCPIQEAKFIEKPIKKIIKIPCLFSHHI